jgi:glycosyltransferase involved in cell wall biosynthesis
VRKKFLKQRVWHVPNAIDPTLKGWDETPSRKDEPLVFGYVAAMHHGKDLSEARGVFAGKNTLTTIWEGEFEQYHEIMHGAKETPTATITKPLPVNKYHFMYNYLDVAIAPLQNTDFNKCKSTLKVVEAGFKKKAFIGSNLSLYREIIKDGVNGFLCNSRAEWLDVVNSMTKDKAEDFGNKLYESIKDTHNIKTINKTRIESIWHTE